jgi:hypothetical protein
MREQMGLDNQEDSLNVTGSDNWMVGGLNSSGVCSINFKENK